MFELQKEFPDKLILGMEIRDVVANYVASKINSIRVNSGFKECLNVGVVKTNTMKTIHNYFRKGSVRSLYLTKFIVGEDVLLLCRPSL
jgi:tRNA (guanine-N7-)-methyltransferase